MGENPAKEGQEQQEQEHFVTDLKMIFFFAQLGHMSTKEGLSSPISMNFRKISKRTLIPPSRFFRKLCCIFSSDFF